ncbi:MAG TPA: amidohydrolase family protein [Candidatus Sulfotelmatobacter sp.]|nr:amidohydrolase family protein [Candidatus Sulfotelmatobacter sp.]
MRKKKIVFSLILCVFLAALSPVAPAQNSAAIVEQGKFTLHKFEQPIGQETYEIRREDTGLTVKVDFKFTDRGTAVPLTVNFRSAPDLTPVAFEIKGRTARPVSIDDAISIQNGKAHLRTRDKESDAELPAGAFFTIAGYAPTTMQMLMVRYWAMHGSPAQLPTLPGGSVKIEPRGQDTIRVGDKSEQLDRYTIEGLIWGRETLWFDNSRNLVAAVTTDAEFDHFEAIRDGYESALADFVARAGADGMAALSEISKGIPGSRASTLAITGATLIDGTGAAPVQDAIVVIRKGRILAAGPRSAVKVPLGAQVFDARGNTVLPGLWDMHAHFEQVEWGPIYLAAGVTTVRDCGNELEFITAVRDAIEQRRGLGPRLLLAGVVDGSGPMAIGVERVDTPEQARMWTDRYHAAGFQQMKIYSSIKLEDLRAVAEEAHRLGMTVTGHVPEGLTGYQTISAGQDQINHVHYIADMMQKPLPENASRAERRNATANLDLNSPEAEKAISFLKEHHTVVDPTIALFELFTATTAKPPASFEPGITKIPPELGQPLTDVGPPNENTEIGEKIFAKGVAIVGALHRAGIPIVAGTDQAVPGHSLHRELELYVQAGFTPMEAIQAATMVPARVMGIDKDTGTIEKGKRADLILIQGNPLEDIRNTRNVEYVVTDGTMYHTAELWQSVGFKP